MIFVYNGFSPRDRKVFNVSAVQFNTKDGVKVVTFFFFTKVKLAVRNL